MISLEHLYQRYLTCSEICIDSRKAQKGAIFFALKGSKQDGNRYALQALANGAAFAVIDNKHYNKDPRCLLVDNCLTALQDLAKMHRNQFKGKVFAFTGFNGKTTTKELIRAVLKTKYNIYSTLGNLNNHIGVPLTILAASLSQDIWLIEMGANKLKDIEELCLISRPTAGLITNIGKAHLEGFGSQENILKGKTELFDFLHANGGEILLNLSDPKLKSVAQNYRIAATYGQQEDHVRLVQADPFVCYADPNDSTQVTQTNLLGGYNIENIWAALAVAKHFDVSKNDANQAIAAYLPTNNRSQLYTNGANTIVLDAYNANPTSMKAALENFNQMQAHKKTVILADMFELGKQSEQAHQEVINWCASLNFDQVIFCGERFYNLRDQQAMFFVCKEDLVAFLQRKPIAGHLILIKGSRSMALETLLEYL